MSPYPRIDRRKSPRLAGMVVTDFSILDNQAQEAADKPDVWFCDAPGAVLTYPPAMTLMCPPEAGNVQFVGPEPDECDDWWPVTARQIVVFWGIAMACGLIIVSMLVLAAGYSCGLSASDVLGTVLAGVL